MREIALVVVGILLTIFGMDEFYQSSYALGYTEGINTTLKGVAYAYGVTSSILTAATLVLAVGVILVGYDAYLEGKRSRPHED